MLLKLIIYKHGHRTAAPSILKVPKDEETLEIFRLLKVSEHQYFQRQTDCLLQYSLAKVSTEGRP